MSCSAQNSVWLVCRLIYSFVNALAVNANGSRDQTDIRREAGTFGAGWAGGLGSSTVGSTGSGSWRRSGGGGGGHESSASPAAVTSAPFGFVRAPAGSAFSPPSLPADIELFNDQGFAPLEDGRISIMY